MSEERDRVYKIKVVTTGTEEIKKLRGELEKVNSSVVKTAKAAKSTADNVNVMAYAFKAFYAVRGVATITKYSDSIQLLRDRLTIFTGSQEVATKELYRLVEAARFTKTSITSLAEVYNRLALSTKDLGLSNDQVLGMTVALQQSFRLSGSSMAEATSSAIQLSQGLASGALRGQELRSVLEANAVLGGLMAEKFKTTRGALIKLGESGTFTTGAMAELFRDAMVPLNKQAAKLATTFEQALVIAMNDFKVKLFEINQQTGLSQKFADAMGLVARNLDLVFIAATSLAATGALYKISAGMGTLSIASALVALKFAAIAVGIGALIYAFSKWDVISASVMIGFYKISRGIDQARLSVIEFSNAYLGTTDDIRKAELKDSIAKSTEEIDRLKKSIDTINKDGKIDFNKLLEGDFKFKQTAGLLGQFEALNRELKDGKITVKEYSQLIKSLEIQEVYSKFDKGTISAMALHDELKKMGLTAKDVLDPNIRVVVEKLEAFDNKSKKARNDLLYLNTAMLDGSIAMREYQEAIKDEKLERIEANFNLGSISAIDLNESLKSLVVSVGELSDADLRGQIVELNKELQKTYDLKYFNKLLKDGVIVVEEYNTAIDQMKTDKIKKDFDDGTISLLEYNEALLSTNAGMEKLTTTQKLGVSAATGFARYNANMWVGIADAAEKSLSTMEDMLVEWSQTGKFVFRDFVMSVLADLNRLVIRMAIIRPLAQGLGASLGGAGTSGTISNTGMVGDFATPSSTNLYAANGMAFSGGKVLPFAKGGIVNHPTIFPMARGAGMMGEAGPEAVMPLSRDSSGKLGVSAASMAPVINIINNSNAQIETKESTSGNGGKTIEVMITNAVNGAIANGSLDKTMRQSYGVSRRGY